MYTFSNSPGVVGTMITGGALPFAIIIGGTDFVPEFPVVTSIKAILTGFQAAQQSGLQIAHTMRDRIYAYIFGERAGRVDIGGLGFAGICTSGSNYTGFDGLQAYYETCRVSAQGAPIRLVLGPWTTFFGFMNDFTFRIEDAATGVGSFSFGFTTMPRRVVSRIRPPLPWAPVGSGLESVLSGVGQIPGGSSLSTF